MTALAPLFRAAGSVLSPGGARAKLTILTYHRVLPEVDALLSNDQVDIGKFARHMAAVAECFTVLSLPDAIERLTAGTLPPRAACITFDDGYQDNYSVALPVLQKHGLVATFFVCSGYLNDGLMFNDVITEALRGSPQSELDLSWLGLGMQPLTDNASRRDLAAKVLLATKYLPFDKREQTCDRLWDMAQPGQTRPRLMMTDEQVQHLSKLGMTIGAHTHTHPILTRISLDAARQDIERNRKVLGEIVGHEPLVFAYPNGRPVRDYQHEHVQLIKELGFSAAVSSAWGVSTQACDRFQLPRFSPWDNDPKRLVLRLLKNITTGQHPTVATDSD
ncbi:MAG: polysaccharide deacetylase family protein [Pseudomonadota bacterium]